MENNEYLNTNLPPENADGLEIPISEDEPKNDTFDILKDISLSDGSNLMDKIQNTSIDQLENNPDTKVKNVEKEEQVEKRRPGILEGAMESVRMDFNPNYEESKEELDDLASLSNSFKELGLKEVEAKESQTESKQAQDKVLLSKQLNNIAKIMAKKIAKYVSAICLSEAKSGIKLTEAQEEILRLNQKIRSLEDQNKKLRLLLTESNRNLNSYKPSIFGLYKKVTPRR